MDDDITLDGDLTEEFWTANTWGRQARIPVGTTFGGVLEFVSITFAQNSTHIFVYADWADFGGVNGTDSKKFSDSDGIVIMWNINIDNMPDEYFDGMKTKEAGDMVDVWIWKPAASQNGLSDALNTTNEEKMDVVGKLYDTSFDDGGWASDSDETTDVQAAATWGFQEEHAENNYVVEFARPLVTDDANDVQFDQYGYFDFAIALYNESSGSSHAVSFQHSVWVQGVCDGADCYDPLYVDVSTTTVTPAAVTETSVSTESPFPGLWVLFAMFSIGIPVYFKRR
jgi:hypothetical protein